MRYEILTTYLFLNMLFSHVTSIEAAEIHWLMANMGPSYVDLRHNTVVLIRIKSAGILTQAIDATRL